MTPYRNDNMSIDRKKYHDSLQEPPSHLSPEESGQTKPGTIIMVQAEQANKQDKKQGDVGNGNGDEGECDVFDVNGYADRLERFTRKLKLWMG